MKQTPNYDLELYELDDMGNLVDGYNHSMEILDGALKQQEENIENILPIDTAGITNGAVTTDKIATAAVTRDKIAEAAFDTAPTADSTNLVTSGAIQAYVTDQLDSFEVSSENIENGAVTTAKIANAAITPTLLSNDQQGFTDAIGAPSLSRGTLIPLSGADLNTYITPGTFVCNSYSAAGNIANCPATNSFKLIVGYGSYASAPSADIQQIIIQNDDGHIFVRYGNSSTNTWSTWDRLATVSEIDQVSQFGAWNALTVNNTFNGQQTRISSWDSPNMNYFKIGANIRLGAGSYPLVLIPGSQELYGSPRYGLNLGHVTNIPLPSARELSYASLYMTIANGVYGSFQSYPFIIGSNGDLYIYPNSSQTSQTIEAGTVVSILCTQTTFILNTELFTPNEDA